MRAFCLCVVASLALALPAAARPLALRDGEGALVFSYAQPDFVPGRPMTTLTFALFAEPTGMLVPRAQVVKYTPEASERAEARLKLPAGDYVLRDVFLFAGKAPVSYCFAPGTILVSVRPGEATYLGALSFERVDAPAAEGGPAAEGAGDARLARVIVGPGDREALEARLPELVRDAAGFSADAPKPASFPLEGLMSDDVGRECAKAAPRT